MEHSFQRNVPSVSWDEIQRRADGRHIRPLQQSMLVAEVRVHNVRESDRHRQWHIERQCLRSRVARGTIVCGPIGANRSSVRGAPLCIFDAVDRADEVDSGLRHTAKSLDWALSAGESAHGNQTLAPLPEILNADAVERDRALRTGHRDVWLRARSTPPAPAGRYAYGE